MKQYTFVINNGNVECFLVEPDEMQALSKEFGRLYRTRQDALDTLKAIEDEKPKAKQLSEDEEEEQRNWALSMITPEERTLLARERKPKTIAERLLSEFDFASEREQWTETETKRKRKRFKAKLRSEYNVARYI